MTKNLLRTVAAVSTVAMCLTLFGCGTGSNAAPGNNAASGSTQAASATTGTVQETKKEPVTLTIYSTSCSTFTPGVQNDPVAKEIERLTGVTMDITTQDSVGDYNTKVAALIASGDLPDIVYLQSDQTDMALKANALLELDSLIETNGKDIKQNMDFRLRHSRKFKSMGTNKLYYIELYGGPSDPTSIATTGFIRWDLYKQLGYPEMNTYEDLLPVLAEMQKKWPETADGKKTYGVSGFFGDSVGWAEWPLTYPTSLLYGIRCDRHLAVNSSTNELLGDNVIDVNSPAVRSLKWYNKANQMGILDPECFTMQTAQYEEKLKAGRIYFTPATWWASTVNSSFEESNNPDKGMMPMPPPKDIKRILLSSDSKYSAGAWCYGISKNCKHPDRAMDLLNFFCTKDGTELLYNGIKGKDWDIVNGTPQFKPETINSMMKVKDYHLQSGINKYSSALAGYQNGEKDERYPNCYVDFSINSDYLKAKATSPYVKDFNERFSVLSAGQLYSSKIPDNTSYTEMITQSLPQAPDDLNGISINVDNYIHNNVVKLVLAKSDAEFDAAFTKYTKDINDMGFQKLFAWEKSEYEKAKKDIDSLRK